jgi:hypothetical protein
MDLAVAGNPKNQKMPKIPGNYCYTKTAITG